MGFFAAIPLIGTLFDKATTLIDEVTTTDEERLQAKQKLMSLYGPVLTSIITAQSSMMELRTKIVKYESQSEHFIVYARRPIISILASLNFIGAAILGYMDVMLAFKFAAIVSGIDMGTRGVEKMLRQLKAKDKI